MSLIPIGCDRWDLNKLDGTECIERARWQYPILGRRIRGVEFDRAESYTFDAAYMYLICTYVIPQCKLRREWQHKNDDTCLLYFYQTFSHFSRYNCIQRDCMIPRSDAFITENTELQSCFMPACSQLVCVSHSLFWFPIVDICAQSTGWSRLIDRSMLVYQEIFGQTRVPCIVYLPPC